MTTLTMNSQRTQFSFVISDLTLCRNDPIETLKSDLFGSYGVKYFAIIHDKDKDVRDHLHLILCFGDKKRVKQVLKFLALAFDTNETNIQVRDIMSFISAIQYLIHKNDKSKYQYESTDILTNENREILENYLNTSEPIYSQLTTEKLIELVCEKGLGDIELLYSIGKDNFKRYLPIINQLRKNHYNGDYGAPIKY